MCSFAFCMQKKKGISLVILVITIIIIIILVRTIILSLTDSNIFDKVSEATDKYNNKQNQIIEDLNCLDDWENCAGKDNTGEEELPKEPEINYEDIVADESLDAEIEILI